MDPTQQPTTPIAPAAATREPEYGRYGNAAPAAVAHDHGHDGPGLGDRLERAVRTPETKEFYKTSEFLVWGLVTAFLLIAAAVVTGDNDNFVAEEAWRYVTIVSAAYIVSRGISKAGTRRGHEHERF
jgi:hypothetical protein